MVDGAMIRTLSVAVALSAALPGLAQARPSWASGTYIYTDLCRAQESETVGQRVTLRRSPLGDTLVYEAATLSGPVQVETVRLDDATKGLAFEAETDGRTIRFTGTLAVDALTGVLENEAGSHPVRLSRVLRPSANPACREERTGPLGAER